MPDDGWPIEIDGAEYAKIPENWIKAGEDEPPQYATTPRLYAVSAHVLSRKCIRIRYAHPRTSNVLAATCGAREDPSEDAALACVLPFGSNRIVIRGTYRGASQAIAIERVAMPVVHDMKGGTDAALAIVEALLPDIPTLEQRVLDVDSRPPAVASECVRLDTRRAMAERGPIERVQQFRGAEPGRPVSTEFVDRVQVSNPFGRDGQCDASSARPDQELASLLTAPDTLVLQLRDHALVRQVGAYTYLIQDISAQRVAGVTNLTVMGTWLDEDSR